jgi:hypothetical protein
MEDPMLDDCIDRACAMVEAETHLLIFPTVIEEKVPWDIHLYRSFGYVRLGKRPVASIEALQVVPSNDIPVYEIPIEWVETANLHTGQLNIIPLTLALTRSPTGSGAAPPLVAGPASAVFLSLFGYSSWIPAWWLVRYTAGFPDGKMPKIVNELIGTVAAMEVLSILAPTFGKANSTSLSIDGMSQSVSTPGPEIFSLRMDELTKKRELLVRKMKALYGTTMFSGEV